MGVGVTYSAKEVFLTVQGEGGQAGRPAVFLRFAGCNLWSGREQDRAEAVCTFCDTDFVGVDGDGGGTARCRPRRGVRGRCRAGVDQTWGLPPWGFWVLSRSRISERSTMSSGAASTSSSTPLRRLAASRALVIGITKTK